MNLMDKLRAEIKVSQITPEERYEVAKLLANLSWFEIRESELQFHLDGSVRAIVYETLPGALGRPALRIRLAEGIGESINEAIEAAAAILRTQEGTDDDATGHK